jgi:hypothetical protein
VGEVVCGIFKRSKDLTGALRSFIHY